MPPFNQLLQHGTSQVKVSRPKMLIQFLYLAYQTNKQQRHPDITNIYQTVIYKAKLSRTFKDQCADIFLFCLLRAEVDFLPFDFFRSSRISSRLSSVLLLRSSDLRCHNDVNLQGSSSQNGRPSLVLIAWHVICKQIPPHPTSK